MAQNTAHCTPQTFGKRNVDRITLRGRPLNGV